MPVDREDLVRALTSKGFQPKQGDHTFYALIVKGKKTSVFTKISHGSGYKVYSEPLLDKVKKQMGLTRSQLSDFIECSLKYDDYVQMLRDQHRIK